MLTIDGAQGEGGGQILRTSLALAAVTGKAFRMERIRGNRRKPGLLRQHLTAVNAMAEVCAARVQGAELASQTLSFEPGPVKHGEYAFAVGTAGSTTLVLQTVLPALLMAAGRSRIVLEGGTHNPMAPPFEFFSGTFLPLLARMGASVRADLTRAGFYPAGGGRLEVDITGAVGGTLRPLELLRRGELQRLHVRAVVSRLPESIARRELDVLQRRLAGLPLELELVRLDSAGPGNIVTVTVHSTELVETFTAFGALGVSAETVAKRVAGMVRKYLAREVPVGEYLADQLLLPLALCGAGAFRTHMPSSHAITNAAVIEEFLPVRVQFEPDDSGHVLRVMPRG
jgi:RNA 3'-terminal phosphate cyclase (ATP)